MTSAMRQVLAVLGLLLCVTSLTAAPAGAAPTVAIPERSRVCMMQDTVMAAPAIPLQHGGRTYYGCCEMCKKRIEDDPGRYTTARDPLSGVVVDKATALLLSVDGRVLYFESETSRSGFLTRLPTTGTR